MKWTALGFGLICCHLGRSRCQSPQSEASLKELSTQDSLPSLEEVDAISVVDLIARRPAINHRRPSVYPKLFAAHAEIKNIPIVNLHSEQIATAFWPLRVRGDIEYPGSQWSHRFTRTINDHLERFNIDPEIISAVQGYLALRLRKLRDSQEPKEVKEAQNSKRYQYLKKFRAKKKAEEEMARNSSGTSSKTSVDCGSPPSTSILTDIRLIMEEMMSMMDYRPTALEVEMKTRKLIKFYSSPRQASYGLRSFLDEHGYNVDAKQLANGARKRYNYAVNWQKKRGFPFVRKHNPDEFDDLENDDRLKDTSEARFSTSTSTNKELGPSVEDSQEQVDANVTSAPVHDLDNTDWWEDAFSDS